MRSKQKRRSRRRERRGGPKWQWKNCWLCRNWKNGLRACARQIEDNRCNCDVEARQKMADAEQRAQRQADEILLRSRGECEKMQQAAREKLDRAAQWIAEEVVRNEWQS